MPRLLRNAHTVAGPANIPGSREQEFLSPCIRPALLVPALLDSNQLLAQVLLIPDPSYCLFHFQLGSDSPLKHAPNVRPHCPPHLKYHPVPFTTTVDLSQLPEASWQSMSKIREPSDSSYCTAGKARPRAGPSSPLKPSGSLEASLPQHLFSIPASL